MSEHKYLTDEEIVGLYLSCPPVAKPLRSDLAACRAELKAAQERAEVAERHLSAAEAHEHLLSRIKTEQSAEIARLREQLKDTDEARLAMVRAASEFDRMRKALELNVECSCHQREDGTTCWLCCALNPQPAQPEKT